MKAKTVARITNCYYCGKKFLQTNMGWASIEWPECNECAKKMLALTEEILEELGNEEGEKI